MLGLSGTLLTSSEGEFELPVSCVGSVGSVVCGELL